MTWSCSSPKKIPYCAREFIKLWYNICNAWLCSFTLRLCVSRDLRLFHCWSTSSNRSKQMFELFPENTNSYTLQKTGNLLDVSKKELEQVIGLFFMTVLVSNLWNRKSICICCRHEQKHVFEHCCSAALCEQYMEDQTLVCFVSWKLSQLVPDDFNLTDQQMVPLKVKFSVTKQYMRNKPHKELKMLCGMHGCTRQEKVHRLTPSESFDAVHSGKDTVSASLRFKQHGRLSTNARHFLSISHCQHDFSSNQQRQ